MQVELEYALLDKDLRNAVRSLPQRRQALFLGGVAAVGVGALAAAAIARGGEVPWLALFVPAVVFAAWLGTPFSAARRLARNLKPEERTLRVRIDEDGYCVESSTARTMIRWSGMHRTAESNTGFLFFATDTSAQFVPKRVLTDADMGVIRTLSRNVVPRKASRETLRVLVLWAVLVLLLLFVWQLVSPGRP